MGHWQAILAVSVRFLDYEGEVVVVYGHFWGACDELQEFVHLFLVELGHYLPEPFYALA